MFSKHLLPVIILYSLTTNAIAQENNQSCNVLSDSLKGSYSGDCKKGIASGVGEAKGIHRYSGSFVDGLPSGKGTYFFSDQIFYTGNFLAGIKEGKGEMHYVRPGKEDSVIKGYWSGNIYRGNRYKTYDLSRQANYDRFDINATPETGNTISIEIVTTSGAPNGTPTSLRGGSGYILSLNDLVALDGTLIRKTNESITARSSTYTYTIDKFPIKLLCSFSDGQNFEVELYKRAKWHVGIYVNR